MKSLYKYIAETFDYGNRLFADNKLGVNDDIWCTSLNTDDVEKAFKACK